MSTFFIVIYFCRNDKIHLKAVNADLMEKLRLVWESYKKLNYNYNSDIASDSDNQVL